MNINSSIIAPSSVIDVSIPVELPNKVYMNPCDGFKLISSQDNYGTMFLKGIGGIIWMPLGILGGICEQSYRGGKVICRKKNSSIVDCGILNIPSLKTERILSKADSDVNNDTIWIKLRDSFLKQNKGYELHRLDFKFTPKLNHELEIAGYRIMQLDFKINLNDGIKCTDINPISQWIEEGLSVKSDVALNANLQFEPHPHNTQVGDIKCGNMNSERNYYYSIQFETLIPKIVAGIYEHSFEWQLFGNYKEYIIGTQFHSAALLVPEGLTNSNVSISVRLGITNRSRKSAEYPATSDLYYSEFIELTDVPLTLGFID